VKGLQGIALASDSRRTYTENGPDTARDNTYWSFDGDMKLLPLGEAPHNFAGMMLAGSISDPLWTLQRLADEAGTHLPTHRLAVATYGMHISEALARRAETPSRWPFRPIVTLAGIDLDGASHVYMIEAPNFVPEEQHVGGLGISWSGMRQYIDVLLHGFDSRLIVPEQEDLYAQFALDAMSLQDSADLARSLAQITVDMVRFIGPYGFEGAGGPIDVATITPGEGFKHLALKGPDPRVERRQFTSAAPVPVVSAPEDIGRPASYTVHGLAVAASSTATSADGRRKETPTQP